MKRRGFSWDKIAEIKHAYHVLFQSRLRLLPAMERVRDEMSESAEIQNLLRFLETSKRGVTR